MGATSFQSFGVVPAAGESRRMGPLQANLQANLQRKTKLLLPWRGRPIIEHVLAAWLESRVDHVVMVARPGDEPLREIGLRMGVDVVVPSTPPAEMKDSVRLALAHVRATYAPGAHDAWLLAPADMPRLGASVVDSLLAAYDAERPETLVPVHSGRRGHPILLPWGRADEVDALPADKGINFLVAAGEVREIEVPDAAICEDLDTPEDFRRLD